MINQELNEIVELLTRIEENQDEHLIRKYLRKCSTLSFLAEESQEMWIDFLSHKRKEIYLYKLEALMDDLGLSGDLHFIEKQLEAVPGTFRDTFIFGYLKGIFDYRLAFEWMAEKNNSTIAKKY